MTTRAKDFYTADGTTQEFPVSFPFISRTHISVTVAGVEADFSFNNDSQISIASPTVNAGDMVIIKRKTSDTTRLVDYVDGSNLTENDLDLDSKQAFYMSQEALDETESVAFSDLDQFDDSAVSTNEADILITDGVEFTNKPVSGDITVTKTGLTTISNDAVTTPKLLNLNVTTDKIADLNVTTNKIANLNVTTGKIADGAITTDKIDPNAVISTKIANDSILNEDINTNAAIDATKIADGTVSNDFYQRVPLGELKVSTNDTTNKTLSEKLTAGDDITIVQENDGGDETLLISTKGELKVSTNDTTVGTLSEKVIAGTGMTIVQENDGAAEGLRFSAAGSPVAWGILQKTADYTVDQTNNHIIFETDTTNGNVVATLPAVSVVGSGFHVGFKKTVFANTLTLTPTGSDTIDEFNTAVLDDQNEYMQLISNGDNWLIIAEEFTEKFLGIKASAPTTDNEGGPLRDGDLYVSASTEILHVYRTSSSSWVETKATSLTNSWERFKVTGQADVVADSNIDAVTFAGANDVAITTDATTDTLTVGLPTYDAGLLYGTLPQGIGYKTVFFGLNVVYGFLQVTDSNNSSATFKPTDYMDSFLAGPDTTFAIDSLGHLQITLT